MLLDSLSELWLAFLSPLLPAAEGNSVESAELKHKEWWRPNANLYWNLELHLNRKVPLHPDVPTNFFSSVSQWIYYKKEVLIMQSSHYL